MQEINLQELKNAELLVEESERYNTLKTTFDEATRAPEYSEETINKIDMLNQRLFSAREEMRRRGIFVPIRDANGIIIESRGA